MDIPDIFKTKESKIRAKKEEKSSYDKLSAKNKRLVAEKGLSKLFDGPDLEPQNVSRPNPELFHKEIFKLFEKPGDKKQDKVYGFKDHRWVSPTSNSNMVYLDPAIRFPSETQL